MTNILNCIAEELAFFYLQGKPSVTKSSNDFIDVLDVFLDIFRKNIDVGDVYEARFPF